MEAEKDIKISGISSKRTQLRRTNSFDKVSCSCLVRRYDLRSDYPTCRFIDTSRVNLNREQGKSQNAKAFNKF